MNLAVTPRASVGVGYYNYLVEDTIGTLTNSKILDNAAQYGDLIVRCSRVPASALPLLTACRDTTGNPIAYSVGAALLNLGDTRTSALDLEPACLASKNLIGAVTECVGALSGELGQRDAAMDRAASRSTGTIVLPMVCGVACLDLSPTFNAAMVLPEASARGTETPL